MGDIINLDVETSTFIVSRVLGGFTGAEIEGRVDDAQEEMDSSLAVLFIARLLSNERMTYVNFYLLAYICPPANGYIS